MALTWVTIQNSIATWAKTYSGITTIWVEQNAPQPLKPYITLNLSSRDVAQGMGVGMDERSVSSASPGVITTALHRRFTLSINCYSNSTIGDTHAAAYIQKLVTTLDGELLRLSLWRDGLKAIPQASGINDLSAMLETRAESRAQIDIDWATLDAVTENVSWIQTVTDTVTVAGTTPAP